MLSAQSDTEAYLGRLGNARDFSRRAVESAKQADAKETAAIWEVNAALRAATFGNAAQARQDAAAALDLSSGPEVRLMAALALAQAGASEQSRKLADRLSQESPLDTMMQGYWLPTVGAAPELDRGNAQHGRELLQPVQAYELAEPPPFTSVGTMYPVYVRGQAYFKAGQGPQAAAEFQKILDHRGIVINFPLGALAHLGLARAYAVSGDTAKAKTAFQDFFALWKNADPDIPILKEAKAEYAKRVLSSTSSGRVKVPQAPK